MTLEIVDAEKISMSDEDVRKIVELNTHPKVRASDTYYRHHSSDLGTMFQRFKDFFQRAPKDKRQLCLLAKLDGNVVGFLGIHRFNEPKNHMGDVGIMVHPDHHCKGIGTKLLKTGIVLARERGLLRLTADTLTENKAMRRIAEKAGFQLEGIRKKNINMYGQLKDEALYALLL